MARPIKKPEERTSETIGAKIPIILGKRIKEETSSSPNNSAFIRGLCLQHFADQKNKVIKLKYEDYEELLPFTKNPLSLLREIISDYVNKKSHE